MRVIELTPSVEGDLTVYPFEVLDGLTLLHTTRDGGVSVGPYASANLGYHVSDEPDAVDENRRRLAQLMGGPVRSVSQVHGRQVVKYRDIERDSEADIIVVAQGEGPAMVMSADCLTAALIDRRRRRLALVHAGWRGLAAGALRAAREQLGDDCLAVVGPAISQAGYQVGPEVAEHFAHVPGALVADGDRFRLDITTVALFQLASLADDVMAVTNRTDTDPLLFSDRAQRPCGRHGLVAAWRPTMDLS